MNAVVMANIDVANQDKQISFQHTGWWYEYFTGDSLQISGNTTISLNPGEYRVYTDIKLAKPIVQNTVDIEDITLANWEVHIFPNPVKDFVNVEINGCKYTPIKITLVDINGKIIQQQTKAKPNKFHLNLDKIQKGIYHLILEQDHEITYKKIIKN